jgi:hypothetical protein
MLTADQPEEHCRVDTLAALVGSQLRLFQPAQDHERVSMWNQVHVAPDSVEALAFLRRRGKYEQVLEEVKQDEALEHIPIVKLSRP